MIMSKMNLTIAAQLASISLAILSCVSMLFIGVPEIWQIVLCLCSSMFFIIVTAFLEQHRQDLKEREIIKWFLKNHYERGKRIHKEYKDEKRKKNY